MNEAARADIWHDYMAAVAHSLGVLMAKFGGGEYPMPGWYELMHPGEDTDDNRSGTDIVNDMINRLRGEEQDVKPV